MQWFLNEFPPCAEVSKGDFGEANFVSIGEVFDSELSQIF